MTRAFATIDRDALTHNLHIIHQLAPNALVLAMVKANGYGHGIVESAQGLADADYFGVASIEEGKLLRESGCQQAIVVMIGPQSEQDIDQYEQWDLQFTLHHPSQVRFLDALTKPRTVWLKIDTGMHRLGLSTQSFQDIYPILKKHQKVKELILLSHLGCADESVQPKVIAQQLAFEELLQGLPEPKSLANGAALIHYPSVAYDIVRPGLLLYGINPTETSLPKGLTLKPAMTLQAPIIDLHHLQPGDWVGYGATWQAEQPSTIATIAIGYGDGYPQHMPTGTPVLLHNKRAHIVGRVAMDMLTIDITGIADVQLGDVVTLWGSALPVTEIAQHANMSVYALLTGVSRRASRFVETQKTYKKVAKEMLV